MIVYPAIFTKEGSGYWVRFPDLDGCLTAGEDLKQAIQMAEEALGGYIASVIERGLPIPEPSAVTSVKAGSEDECAVVIYSDVDKYFAREKSVKKTLTIPSWLNDLAESKHVNYSAILQQALKAHLDL